MTALHATRRRQPFLAISAACAAGFCLLAWLGHLLPGAPGGWFPNLTGGDLTNELRLSAIGDFLADAAPRPLREGEGWGTALSWAVEILQDRGLEAAGATLAVSVIAVCLAGAAGFAAAFFTARRPGAPGGFFSLAPLRAALRLVLVGLRAVPELIWAFVLLSAFGVSAWTGILALALHNAGILGKLGAEVIEGTTARAGKALQGLGAGGGQIAAAATLPSVFQGFLAHFFYRWECCLRDAIILGFLGLPSLGYWVFQDAWPKFRYDEILLYVLLGAVLVLAADVASDRVRGRLRKG